MGSNVELLDAYVTGGFDVSGITADLRLGWHVLNWGESTFIPNGINAINPFDVSKLRLPGSELREALLPVGMASASVAPTDALSVDAFYQFDWEKTGDRSGRQLFLRLPITSGPGARKAVITVAGGLADGYGPQPGQHDSGSAKRLTTGHQLRTSNAPSGRDSRPDSEQQRMSCLPAAWTACVTIRPAINPPPMRISLSVLRRPADEERRDAAGQWGVGATLPTPKS